MEHTFNASLDSGHKWEDIILNYLEQFYTVRHTTRNKVTSEGDAWLRHIPGMPNPFNETDEFLIEIKQDCSTWKTGFTAHEIYRKDKSGNVTASGLSKTDAKYYVFGYSHRPDVWFIDTENFRQLVDDGYYYDIKDFTGDGKKETTVARFVPKHLHGHAKHLFNRVIKKPNITY